MRRIAYASPVNPAPSGIADYSEELLPYLGRYADLTVYIDDDLRPSNPQLARQLDVRPLRRLARDQRRRPYDAIVYHIGNSSAHAQIWRTLRSLPGVVVLHDLVLHHFMLQWYAAGPGGVQRYRSVAADRYGAEGARVADLMMRGRFVEQAFDFPFCEDVLDAASGIIAHSQYVVDCVRTMRPALPAALVPMGVPLPPQRDRIVARAQLGLPADALILASFGHINPYKRVDAVLRALAVLRAEGRDARYLLVGSVSPAYDLRGAVARVGLSDAVVATGYVAPAAFAAYVAAADICLNLRHPTAGETSASLLRLLGAGKPTLVSASGAFAELPAGVAAQVDFAGEDELILAYCRRLADDPALAGALGAAARSFVAAQHTLDAAARGYMAFLAQVYGWSEGLPDAHPAEDGMGMDRVDPVGAKHSGGNASPLQPSPHPIPSIPPGDPLHDALAAAIVDLGATENDVALLAAAARARIG